MSERTCQFCGTQHDPVHSPCPWRWPDDPEMAIIHFETAMKLYHIAQFVHEIDREDRLHGERCVFDCDGEWVEDEDDEPVYIHSDRCPLWLADELYDQHQLRIPREPITVRKDEIVNESDWTPEEWARVHRRELDALELWRSTHPEQRTCKHCGRPLSKVVIWADWSLPVTRNDGSFTEFVNHIHEPA